MAEDEGVDQADVVQHPHLRDALGAHARDRFWAADLIYNASAGRRIVAAFSDRRSADLIWEAYPAIKS